MSKINYAYEIIEALIDHTFNGNKSYLIDDDEIYELLDILHELYTISHDYVFQSEIDQICEDHEICNVCRHGHLRSKRIGGEVMDVWGVDTERPEYAKFCENCGAEF